MFPKTGLGGKLSRISITLCLGAIMAFCFSFRFSPDGNLHVEKQLSAEVEANKRDCIVSTAQNLVGKVVEKTGKNDHPMIDTFFVKIGQKGLVKAKWQYKPWCVAFTGWCLISCGVNPPVAKGGIAAVRNWEAAKEHLKPQSETLKGDIVTYTSWSHGEVVKDYNRNPRIYTFRAIGGNTEDPNGTGKYGVWEKTRQKRQIKKVIDTVYFNPSERIGSFELLPVVVQAIES